jgi:hypothetical protein
MAICCRLPASGVMLLPVSRRRPSPLQLQCVLESMVKLLLLGSRVDALFSRPSGNDESAPVGPVVLVSSYDDTGDEDGVNNFRCKAI